MRLEEMGIVGNCQFSALVDTLGSVVWCCLPRFDSPPIFSSLLAEEHGGRFRIAPASGVAGKQSYLDNSNVLVTHFTDETGSFRVIDFAPRFIQNGRTFRPTLLLRVVEPLEGAPRIRVECSPTRGWSKKKPGRLDGSNHVRFEGFDAPLRLTTDIALSWLDGTPFTLTKRRHFALAWGPPLEESLEAVCDRFLQETVRYWQRWVRHCNVPALYQREVIRSALALKLHVFEDTGAIVAAMTTSIPESAGSGRTWDYRYCWLRDAYYALDAFRLLGHFEEREGFVEFLLNIAGSVKGLELAPLYRIDGRSELEESTLSAWPGYEGDGPVRIGNAAALHRQHDVYGELVLALAPSFFDERFKSEDTTAAIGLVDALARKAIEVAGTPDNGIWEHRSAPVAQTFSGMMCWAAADRAARIFSLRDRGRAAEFHGEAERIRTDLLARAWNRDGDFLAATYGGTSLDASLLQAAKLRFLDPGDPRLTKLIERIRADLGDGAWLRRYRVDDGFGVPSVAFIICTFWLVDALAIVGQQEEAKRVFDRALASLPAGIGLLAEDIETKDGRLRGNFPQAYSHVGMIHAAFSASTSWSDLV